MSQNPLTRKEQGEQTKLTILEAARDLFLSESYDSISTQDIAVKASAIAKEKANYKETISKASIFNHFESKDKLAQEVAKVIVSQMGKEIHQLRLADIKPIVLLRNFISYTFEFMLTRPKMTQFFLELTAKMHEDDLELFMESFSIMMKEFGEIVIQLDLKNSKTIETKTRLLFALLDGLAFHLYFEKVSFQDKLVKDLINEIMEMIENWIKPKK